MFMHRGDSVGEGESSVYFLANKKTRYEPCGNLLDKLSSRLTDQAIVITDSSNTSIGPLRRFYRSKLKGCEAFKHLRGGMPSIVSVFAGPVWAGWFTAWFGPPLNNACSADDKPYPPAYLPVAMSQTFNSPGALSMDPPAEANSRPSGLNATEWTNRVFPLRVVRILPEATSRKLTL